MRKSEHQQLKEYLQNNLKLCAYQIRKAKANINKLQATIEPLMRNPYYNFSYQEQLNLINDVIMYLGAYQENINNIHIHLKAL